MDERIDILNEDGSPTGITQMKSFAHANGLFHATVHIWFYTKEKQILLQKRALNKDTFPGLWDVSVAGHIGAGEEIIDSALRETQEEIGLEIQKEDLQKIGVFKSVQDHSASLLDREFHHSFIAELTVPFASLTKQKSEVNDLKLMPIDTFLTALKTKQDAPFVPHSLQYYDTIVSAIKQQLL